MQKSQVPTSFNKIAAWRAIAFCGWLVTIWVWSDLPGTVRPELEGKVSDKWVHFVVFFGLGALLVRWIRSQGWGAAPGTRVKQALLVTVTVSVYAYLDELHQHYVPGRVYDIADWHADTLGGMTAAAILLLPESWQRLLLLDHPSGKSSPDDGTEQPENEPVRRVA
jgi:VanZ family protein